VRAQETQIHSTTGTILANLPPKLKGPGIVAEAAVNAKKKKSKKTKTKPKVSKTKKCRSNYLASHPSLAYHYHHSEEHTITAPHHRRESQEWEATSHHHLYHSEMVVSRPQYQEDFPASREWTPPTQPISLRSQK
jgi:hypothetical protein